MAQRWNIDLGKTFTYVEKCKKLFVGKKYSAQLSRRDAHGAFADIRTGWN